MKEKVVYVHPEGRFEVVERTGTNRWGDTYQIREAFLTPDKDARGQLHGMINKVSYRPSKWLSDDQIAQIERLYGMGVRTRDIARKLGIAESTVHWRVQWIKANENCKSAEAGEC